MSRARLAAVVVLATVGLAGCADGTGSKTPRAAAPVDLGTEPITQLKNQPSIREINGMAYLDGPVDKWPSQKRSSEASASTPAAKPATSSSATTSGGGAAPAAAAASTPVSSPAAAIAPGRKTTTAAKPATSSNATRKTPGIGGSATIVGSKAGTRLRVKLMTVIDDVEGSQIDEADDGKRYVGVRLRLTNTGSRVYSDSPSNGATLVTSADKQEDATILTGGSCESSSSVTLRPGAARVVCIAFEVDEARKPKTFQFKLDSGFADDLAEFKLRRHR